MSTLWYEMSVISRPQGGKAKEEIKFARKSTEVFHGLASQLKALLFLASNCICKLFEMET